LKTSAKCCKYGHKAAVRFYAEFQSAIE